jgi:hypothetical protein
MRQVNIDKPKAIKALAHVFTKFMCANKTHPVLKISSTMYSELIATPPEYADRVFLYGTSQSGGYGKVLGVEFIMDYSQQEDVKAFSPGDQSWSRHKDKILSETTKEAA